MLLYCELPACIVIVYNICEMLYSIQVQQNLYTYEKKWGKYFLCLS